MKAKIKGGYYIKARKIQESKIAIAPPHIREIWDWLLKECNHSDKKYRGIIIKRGQCIRSYRDIIEGLKWKIGWRTVKYSKHQCENAMKWLKKGAMITTQRTTVGFIITVSNYSFYQNPANYECHKGSRTTATRLPQGGDDNKTRTIKNKKNDIKEVMKYFNKKTGNQYSANTSLTRKFISGRLNEHSLEDLKKVIDYKVLDWQGSEYEKFLRPKTLFRPSNFEDYLNSADREMKKIKDKKESAKLRKMGIE